jgi:glycosyltransferase involved in cell wall biosynthesis
MIEEHRPLTDPDVLNANFHLYYSRSSRALIAQIRHFQRERAARRKAPIVIYDSDDHVDMLSIWNPRFVTLGSRLPDGTKMCPGDRIEVAYEDENIVLWEDGAVYPNNEQMDVAKNLALMNLLKIMARACDGVTASTEYLANVYRGYGCKNVYTFPNSLLEEDYPEIHPRRPKRVTILWQGGHSHYEDWLTILEPLRIVCESRPEVRVLIWGQDFPAVKRSVPERNYEYMPWLPYNKYTYRLATLGHHINICPLVDNEFNRAKSAIKWMESSAITHPAATLAANVGPYAEAIKHGETGMLYSSPNEFVDMLIELIDSASLRRSLGRRAHEDVWDTYHIARTAPGLGEWYRKMLFRNWV